MGARGVNNLASKLLLTLLPPNQPFFRTEVEPFELAKVKQAAGADSENLLTQIQAALSLMDQSVIKEGETLSLRVHLFEALRHLIVAGNALMFVPVFEGETVRVFPLSKYVVKRDPSGNLLRIVIEETVSPLSLSQDVREQLSPEDVQGQDSDEPTVTVFTAVFKTTQGNWASWQEVSGRRIPGTDALYPANLLPYLALRFTKLDGEDYGAAYAAEYEGDLQSLESLSQSLVTGSAAAAKVVGLVDPNGTTRIKRLAEARSGDFIEGDKEDVSFLQLEKFNDFTVVRQEKGDIEARLNSAFLLNSSVQRQAERVTAEEIKFMARELEDALGGVYSLLSEEEQRPLVDLLRKRMERRKRLPATIPKEITHTRIVTGFDALGRGHEVDNLNQFVASGTAALGPQVFVQFVHPDDLLLRLSTGLGINSDGLLKTKAELDQENKQAQLQAMLQKLGPNAVNKLGDYLNQNPGIAQQLGQQVQENISAQPPQQQQQ